MENMQNEMDMKVYRVFSWGSEGFRVYIHRNLPIHIPHSPVPAMQEPDRGVAFA